MLVLVLVLVLVLGLVLGLGPAGPNPSTLPTTTVSRLPAAAAAVWKARCESPLSPGTPQRAAQFQRVGLSPPGALERPIGGTAHRTGRR